MAKKIKVHPISGRRVYHNPQIRYIHALLHDFFDICFQSHPTIYPSILVPSLMFSLLRSPNAPRLLHFLSSYSPSQPLLVD